MRSPARVSQSMQPGRILLSCLLVVLASPAFAAPDEELLGKARNYPLGTRASWFFDEGVRVGSFSHLDEILPHNRLSKAVSPLPLAAAGGDAKLGYRFENQSWTLDDFLSHQRVTGLLVIKDRTILFERYQYDRKPADRFVSHSMAKSIVSLAVGMALAEGRIGSLDDLVSKYVPKLAGSPYGETTIRHVLRMSSGVQFKEAYDGNDDLTRFTIARNREGSISALRQFQTREAVQGARFHYASSETVILAVLLRAVTGTTLSEYLTARLWQPMGAEADATWVRTTDGTEAGSGSFNATLRDYGRLGMLLANDGAVGGKQIVPKDYLLDATDWHRQPKAFTPGKATPYFGYGYQFWLYPGEKRRFGLLGVYGQSIFVDPELKLVMVITAVAKNATVGKESFARERDAVWRGIVGKYGSW
ncbi:serine hydrolase [Bradyrhizobium sp. AUGA SZCCT0182]|uniref:serine hydrolase domain-containing protein n=1 Tax=Bradyrhizobium sp. AUGA SZCCT0182 TaxID=2807667 RepID=UPI001BAE261C|nr:serine hydrolase [Bradyrhizobium sp. AUGA SZCCT0182]MBR1235960.1 serine hydrolase [Bradyrhizobium sp. AUGA SZCCT0182]